MAVVLGYDESPGAEAALDAAIQVAQRYGEELVLVYGAAPPGGMGEEFKSHRDALLEMGRAATAHALEKVEAAGVTARVRLVDAKPADALIQVGDAARRDGHRGRHRGRQPDPRRAPGVDPAQAAAPGQPAGALRAGGSLRTARSPAPGGP